MKPISQVLTLDSVFEYRWNSVKKFVHVLLILLQLTKHLYMESHIDIFTISFNAFAGWW